MSLPTHSSNNLKTLSKAISLVVFAGFSSYGHAVDFGRTTILSKQYEPLNASIDVKNITDANFDVSMANNSIYQQMGLSAKNRVSVKFVRTSNDTGKIVLTTNVPVNDPFADVVLNIKDNGKKRFMPKTLLMPVGAKPVVATQKQIVANSRQTQTLPVVTQQSLSQGTVMPAATQAANNMAATQANGANNMVARSTNNFSGAQSGSNRITTNEPPIQPHELAALNISESAKTALKAKAQARIVNSDQALLKDRKTIASVKQKNAQNIQAHQNRKQVRQQKPVSKVEARNKSNQKYITTSVSAKPNVEPPIGSLSGDQHLLKAKNNLQAKNNRAATKIQVNNKKARTTKKVKVNKRFSGKNRYIVQRNDNLWSIANEIAKRNKVSVAKVMQQIHQNNPQAFINGNKNRIVANSKLTLPDYKVMPSQNSLQNAIAAKKTKKKHKAGSKSSVRNNKYTAKSKKPTRTKKAYKKPTKKKSSYKKPKVSLVASNNSKKAAGNSASGSAGKSSRASNSQLVSQLRSTRQNAASKVNKVNKLSSKVDSYSQKLKIQNKKLAELEARLKKLKGK